MDYGEQLARDFIADVRLDDAGSLLGSVLTCLICRRNTPPVHDRVQAAQMMHRHRAEYHRASEPVPRIGPNARIPKAEPFVKPIREIRAPQECSIDGCSEPVKSRGWCVSHYRRWLKTGDVQADKPIRSWVRRESAVPNE